MRDILSLIIFLKENDADKIPISLQEKIEQIENSANYGLALVYSSIKYINISNENINFSEFNLEDIANHVLNNSLNTNNLKLELINCNRTISTSKYAIQLAFQNLMSDSLKFNNKNTCVISISSKIENDRLFIDYKDNGPGIEIKYAHKIFEIFETLNSKSETSLGIGLSMVKKILNKLSGNIQLMHSESGKGVHFNIDLPLEI
jgi:signal transduction histidine kinase